MTLPAASCTYVRHLEVNRPVRVEDVVEQVAVVVVGRELGLQRRLELERRRGGLQLGVDVLVAADRGHAVELLHAIVLHLLAVLAGHNLLLGVGAVVVPAHACVWVCGVGLLERVGGGVVNDEAPRAENSTIRSESALLAPTAGGARAQLGHGPPAQSHGAGPVSRTSRRDSPRTSLPQSVVLAGRASARPACAVLAERFPARLLARHSSSSHHEPRRDSAHEAKALTGPPSERTADLKPPVFHGASGSVFPLSAR